jgi:hypothetical protein
MAKSAFGSYSSVPTTGGLGQGAAQVFAPQAIATDMTQFGKGLSTAATGAAQLISDVKDQRAEIEQKIKEQEKLEKGEYDYTNGLTESINSDLDALVDPNSEYRNKRGKVKLGSIKDINKEIDDIIDKSNNIKQYESAWRGVYDSAPDNDKFWNSQSNSWESTKDFAKNKLLNPPSQQEIDALKSGDLGVIVRKQLFDFDGGIKLGEDNFNEDILKSAKEFALSKDAITKEEYNTTSGRDILTKNSFYSSEQLGQFKNYMYGDEAAKETFADRYIVDNNIPPQNRQEVLASEEFNTLWRSKVDGTVDEIVQRRNTETVNKAIVPKTPTVSEIEEAKKLAEYTETANNFKKSYSKAQNIKDLGLATEELNKYVRDVDARVEVVVGDDGKRMLDIYKSNKLVKTIPLDNSEAGYRAFTDLGVVKEKGLKLATSPEAMKYEDLPILKARGITEKIVKTAGDFSDNSREDLKKSLEQDLPGVTVDVTQTTITFSDGKDEQKFSLPKEDDDEELQKKKYTALEDFLSDYLPDESKQDISSKGKKPTNPFPPAK